MENMENEMKTVMALYTSSTPLRMQQEAAQKLKSLKQTTQTISSSTAREKHGCVKIRDAIFPRLRVQEIARRASEENPCVDI